jgi:hypothetical protein
MKSLFSKLIAASIAVCIVTFFVVSCSVQDLTQDLTLYTGNGFLVNPITIQVGDAAKLEVAPDQLTITVEGRDKDKIFTMFGEKKIRAISGIVALAVKIADAPSATQPLEFTLVFSAPNFTTVKKNYSLKSTSELKIDEVKMVNLNALPSGASLQNGSFTSAAATGAAQDVSFDSPLTNGKIEQVSAVLKTGTKPLAADGSVLSGAVQTQLIHFDTRSEASLSGLSDGFTGLSVKDATATTVSNIVPAGFYSLNMTVGTTKVSKFSAPLDVAMDINPEFYDVNLGRKIQEGDVLDVISRDESETVWTAETQATVVKTNGKLKATFKQAHLSTWIVGSRTSSTCTTALKVSSDFATAKDANCAVPLESFRYKLVDAKNNNIVYKSGVSTLTNGEILESTVYSDPKIETQLIVTDLQRNVIYTSPIQKLCTSGTFDLKTKLPANKSVVVKVNVSALCSGAINTVFTPSNVTLLYRDMASPATAPFGGWLPLITVVDGKGCAKGLIVGRTYDFGLAIPISATQAEIQTFSKDLKQPAGLTIPTGDLTIQVNSPVYGINNQPFTIKKGTDGVYNLNYTTYPLPANICTELDKKFSVFLTKK